MVTEEERDFMVGTYARDPQSRVNLGIRRRLAPLLDNNRKRIELMNALLFSLPGTPVLYYGDEIGMGDNVYLGDRNGVRTPMQWSPDRNAGFSRANTQKLFSPPIVDPEYHYEAINVDTQQRNPSSLLWWTKRIIALRSLVERRRKRSPLVDVAGMLRSFHYATFGPLAGRVPTGRVRPGDVARLEPWAQCWYRWVGAAFLEAYLETMAPAKLLPTTGDAVAQLLDLHLIEKALYELGYELNHRPERVAIPLRGILDVLDARRIKEVS